jgi:transcription termination/antitermination protein NusA
MPMPDPSDDAENLVVRLVSTEIPAVRDGAVSIKAVARVTGQRTQVAVASAMPGVRAVRAFVGTNGVHVQRLASVLGEPVDILRWSADIEHMIRQSFAPMDIHIINLRPETCEATVGAGSEQVSMLAISTALSCTLAGRLTGWTIRFQAE